MANIPTTQAGVTVPITGQDFVATGTGGGATTVTPTQIASSYTAPPATAIQPSVNAGADVQGWLNSLLSADNSYIQNARTTGLEQAAARGLRNSSIAAGASQRSAIDAAAPILSQITGLAGQREQQAVSAQQSQFDRSLSQQQLADQQRFGAEQAAIDRQQQYDQAGLDRTQTVNNQLLQAQLAQNQAAQQYQYQSWLQGDQATQQDWLNSNQYTRQFNGELAALPVKTAADLASYIAQYAVQNPQVYTPQVASGMQNFFTGSMASLFQQYFPNLARTS